MKLKLPLSFARLLKLLLTSEQNYGNFKGRNRALLTQFLEDTVLDYSVTGLQHRRIFCPDASNLQRYLHNKFEIPSLDLYIDFLEKEESQRSDAVRAAADSKIRNVSVFTGFFLNCLESVRCELFSNPFLVTPVAGAFTFISAYKHFRIPPEVTVVIVEGHENFREIQRQRDLFSGVKPLFVWRYQNSNAIASWLNAIPNPYVHFGDFDPKGIHIYLSEFKAKISGNRGKFFVPPDIEKLLPVYGESDLYERQKALLPKISRQAEHELDLLILLLMKYKKGLAQEILIQEADDMHTSW